MKLRNKRTGEIADVEIQSNCLLVTHQDGRIEQYYFDSIKDLLEWENYKPAEPLIKDEKIRKAVRAWAEANNIRAAYYSPDEQGFYVKNYDDEIVASIYFGDKPMEKYDYDWGYTIAELCGEEEE